MGSNETRNLYIALGAGLFAAFLIYSYSHQQKEALEESFGGKKKAVIAREDIAEMSTVYDTMIEIQEIPNEYFPQGAVSDPVEVIGNVSAVPIKKGQLIFKNHLLQPGPDTGVAMQVAPQRRAVSVPVDEVHGVAKLVRPGDRVDIFAAIDTGKGTAVKREVFLLMEDVPVLATGVSIVNNIPRIIEQDSTGKSLTQTTLTGDTKYSTITVEAKPEKAQDLIYVLSTSPGNLYFTLRNPTDKQQVSGRLPASTADTIVGRPMEAVTPVAPMAPVVPQAPAPTPNRPNPPKGNNKPGSYRRI